MAKGYIVASIDVRDATEYQKYVAASSAAMAKYGVKPIVRGGRCEVKEGSFNPRNVILEFESFEAAQKYYHSPEYQAAIPLRLGVSSANLMLIEGA
ncbi:MAG: DUF1330 domain-containing protein [Hyphomicrobiales bacterium]|nr:DUF1330 domain-containing protein [Hyphomicrobiales bacterium]